MTNITELVTQLDQNTTDFDGGHRPASVTESCTGAIPETIMEENEAQRKLSKDISGNVTSTEHEVSVETEPLMTISNDISDTTSPSYLPPYNSIDKYEKQSNVEISDFLLGDSPIPIPTLEREPASRYGSQPQEQKFDFSEKGLELEPMTRQLAEQNEADALKHTTVIGNSKVKPNNPAFDAAIGFLLETKKDKRPVVIKRVKFNN